MKILGLMMNTHDAGVALTINGVPEIVIEEERLNREKRTKDFPVQGLTKLLEMSGLKISDFDAITTPWDTAAMRWQMRKMILRRFPLSLNLARAGASPGHTRTLQFSRFIIKRRLQKLFPNEKIPDVLGIGHHNSHAACFFISPFEEATALIMDGYGDNCSTSVYQGQGNRLKQVYKNNLLDSLGVVYTLVSQYLGFAAFGDEGKVMGLSAYGTETYVRKFRDVITLLDNGQYRVNMDYFSYDKYGQIRPFKQKFYDTFGPARDPKGEFTQQHKDIAYALQVTLEEAVLHIVRHLAKTYPSKNLYLSGGVAMNCVATARILRDSPYEKIWLPPCASDTGVPLGSTLWHYYQDHNKPRHFEVKHAFYGCSYNDSDIESALQKAGLSYEHMQIEPLIDRVSDDLTNGKILGWFQGRFEMGPRALGNRSILADPRRAEMKDKINARIKYREGFRPFAPAVLYEEATKFFEINQPDPFMTIAPRVRPEQASKIPAVVHVDNTARFQTVEREANPRYYDLIKAFGQKTGIPVLLNSSFNKQEPIVARPEEAVSCYLRTEMDVLVMGNYYVTDRNPEAIKRAKESF